MIFSVVQFILVFVEVVTALLLIGVILIQRTKSQGLGLAFGSGMGESLFGAHVGNVLTKATVVLAVVFLLNTTILSLMQSNRREVSVVESTTVAPLPVAPPSGGLPTPSAPAAAPTPTALPTMEMSGTMAPSDMPAADTMTMESPVEGTVDVDVPVVEIPAEPAAPADQVPVPSEPVNPASVPQAEE